jgi:hypothetical protein
MLKVLPAEVRVLSAGGATASACEVGNDASLSTFTGTDPGPGVGVCWYRRA